MDPRTLPPLDPSTGLVNVYVECARGAKLKHKFHQACGARLVHKVMPRGVAWPFPYGFICGTRGHDGDPLDAVVLTTHRTEPGTVLAGRMLGAIEADQTVEGRTHRNDRFVVADTGCPACGAARTLDEVAAVNAPGVLDAPAIEQFFVEYNRAQSRTFTPLRRLGPADALRLVQAACVGSLR